MKSRVPPHWAQGVGRLALAASCSLVVATGGGVATPAQAQTGKLYRCGNTFSQAPCGADATEKKMVGAGHGGQARDPMVGARACLVEAKLKRLHPPTAEVVSVDRGQASVIQYAGQPLVSRPMRITVTFVSASSNLPVQERLSCVMSEDEQRVLSVRLH